MLAWVRKNGIEAFIYIFTLVGLLVTSDRPRLLLMFGAGGLAAGIIWRGVRKGIYKRAETSEMSAIASPQESNQLRRREP